MSESTSLSLLESARREPTGGAWTRLDSIYRPWLLRLLRGQGIPSHDAEDVCQDTLMRLARRLSSFVHNGFPGAFRNYLKKILASCLSEHKAKRARNREVNQELARELSDPKSDLSRKFDAEYDQHVVRGLLDYVAQEFQPQTVDAFRGVVLEGKKPAEVAAELSMTAGAVRTAQSRVLAALRKAGAGLVDIA